MTTATTTDRDPTRATPRVRLEVIAVPQPCHVEWAGMTAVDGDRVRHCGQCDKHVFNLSAMQRGAAERFLADRVAGGDGHVCVRLYKRADGTVVTADCRGRWRAAVAGRFARWGGAVGATLSIVLAAVWGGPTRGQVPVMGAMRPVPASQPSTNPAAPSLMGRVGTSPLTRAG